MFAYTAESFSIFSSLNLGPSLGPGKGTFPVVGPRMQCGIYVYFLLSYVIREGSLKDFKEIKEEIVDEC